MSYIGHKGQQYTETERAELVEARRLGFTFEEIAVLIGRPSGASCRMQYDKIQNAAPVAARPHRPHTTRPCLTCRRPFRSEGAHNRMCDSCRAGAESVSPYEPDGSVTDFAACAA